MPEDKAEGKDVAPSMNPEERPDLEDYKSKDKRVFINIKYSKNN